MHEPEPTDRDGGETREELIERLLAKAELDYKCCGSHCSSFTLCTAGVENAE